MLVRLQILACNWNGKLANSDARYPIEFNHTALSHCMPRIMEGMFSSVVTRVTHDLINSVADSFFMSVKNRRLENFEKYKSGFLRSAYDLKNTVVDSMTTIKVKTL